MGHRPDEQGFSLKLRFYSFEIRTAEFVIVDIINYNICTVDGAIGFSPYAAQCPYLYGCGKVVYFLGTKGCQAAFVYLGFGSQHLSKYQKVAPQQIARLQPIVCPEQQSFQVTHGNNGIFTFEYHFRLNVQHLTARKCKQCAT
ncbi:MAG: hypothetical protein BWY70_01685 [Bacteroidetes bacterium ADurb.Bin408]|nr:MAG: hypothetical protein BWY70_01685 [Bacteroidetes bacterium ADurb.Bin408]